MPKMTINPIYEFGDIVYIKAHTEPSPHQVIGFQIVPGGLLYKCVCDDEINYYYAFELEAEKPARSSSEE